MGAYLQRLVPRNYRGRPSARQFVKAVIFLTMALYTYRRMPPTKSDNISRTVPLQLSCPYTQRAPNHPFRVGRCGLDASIARNLTPFRIKGERRRQFHRSPLRAIYILYTSRACTSRDKTVRNSVTIVVGGAASEGRAEGVELGVEGGWS